MGIDQLGCMVVLPRLSEIDPLAKRRARKLVPWRQK
jgi:hypothetical protein